MPIPSPFTHPVLATAAAAAVAILAAACGSTSPTTATSGAQKSGDGEQAAFQYATCMRDHGLTGFPDPVVHVSSSGGSTHMAVGIRVTPAITGSPRFKSAQAACAHILPGPSGTGPSSAQRRAKAQALLAFARCLRTHGEPNFPDPNGHGELSFQQVTADVDIHAPQFLTAAKACVGVTHGMITGADVERAIHHGG